MQFHPVDGPPYLHKMTIPCPYFMANVRVANDGSIGLCSSTQSVGCLVTFLHLALVPSIFGQLSAYPFVTNDPAARVLQNRSKDVWVRFRTSRTTVITIIFSPTQSHNFVKSSPLNITCSLLYDILRFCWRSVWDVSLSFDSLFRG